MYHGYNPFDDGQEDSAYIEDYIEQSDRLTKTRSKQNYLLNDHDVRSTQSRARHAWAASY